MAICSSINASSLLGAPGGPRLSGTLKLNIGPECKTGEEPASKNKKRAGFYVDGFNLFHAIDDYGQPHLKWVDLWALAQCIINKRAEQLVRVVWCSAEYRFDYKKQQIHRAYQSALQAKGVEIALGHFVREPITCRADCQMEFEKPTEKAGDVNVALHLIVDAFDDLYDTAYLVTADSDQTATVDMFKRRFPNKEIIAVAPPGREHSKYLIANSDGNRTIFKGAIEACLLGKTVTSKGGFVAQRPQTYDPPSGWKKPSLTEVRAAQSGEQKPKKIGRRHRTKALKVERKPRRKIIKR